MLQGVWPFLLSLVHAALSQRGKVAWEEEAEAVPLPGPQHHPTSSNLHVFICNVTWGLDCSPQWDKIRMKVCKAHTVGAKCAWVSVVLWTVSICSGCLQTRHLFLKFWRLDA